MKLATKTQVYDCICIYLLFDFFVEFGIQEVEILIKKFKNTLQAQDIEVAEISVEWQLLKKLVYKRYVVINKAQYSIH